MTQPLSYNYLRFSFPKDAEFGIFRLLRIDFTQEGSVQIRSRELERKVDFREAMLLTRDNARWEAHPADLSAIPTAFADLLILDCPTLPAIESFDWRRILNSNAGVMIFLPEQNPTGEAISAHFSNHGFKPEQTEVLSAELLAICFRLQQITCCGNVL